jgi:excinuclease ABC subunit C
MSDLFSCPPFLTLGRSRYLPHGESSTPVRVSAERPSGLRTQVRLQCPRCPGVYGMMNGRGELIYVGKAKRLRARLLSYFRSKSRDPKAGRILDHTRSLLWESVPSEFTALLRELELIQRWRPRFNVQGQPGRRRPAYICIGREPAPYVFLARIPPAGALVSFGPIPSSWRAGEAVRRLNDSYRLRDCSQSHELVFTDQSELYPVERTAGCLRYEIGTCLGPCIGACSRQAYRAKVRAARAFLSGADVSLLGELEREMRLAARDQEFERAASLRDKLEQLRWLHEHLDRLRCGRLHECVIYPVSGQAGPVFWYVISGGRIRTVLRAPYSAVDRQNVTAALEVVCEENVGKNAPAPPNRVEEVLLLMRWFRRYPAEAVRLRTPEKLLSDCRNYSSPEPS